MKEPSLSERLNSLGVRLGTQHLSSQKPTGIEIERVVPGRWEHTINGDSYIVEKVFPADSMHGDYPLRVLPLAPIILAYAQHSLSSQHEANQYAFLDLETTGLSGSAGTYAFLIGVGRNDPLNFILNQFFLTSPAEEAAQLTALSRFLDGVNTVITFNGKTFDLPVLATRYAMHGMTFPLKDVDHLDLLFLARRLWRQRLPSRTLIDLESQVLGVLRSQADVPSWVIPQLYYDYLKTNDARLIKSVFYHNEIDILSMLSLLNHLSDILIQPLHRPETHALDLVGIANLYEALGQSDLAIEIYSHCLNLDLPIDLSNQIKKKISFFYKQCGEWDAAIDLWLFDANHDMIYAQIELAKVNEHRFKNIEKAKYWTLAALKNLENNPKKNAAHPRLKSELQIRLERLGKKAKS